MIISSKPLLNGRHFVLLIRERRRAASPLALTSKTLDDVDHLLPAAAGVNHLVGHAHVDLLHRVGEEQLLDEQVPHEDAHEDAAVVAVLLLRALLDVLEPQLLADDGRQLAGGHARLLDVDAAERVVVESHAVERRHEEQRPVRPSLGSREVLGIRDGQEHVRHAVELGQLRPCLVDGRRHEQERHGGPKQVDSRLRVARKNLVVQPSVRVVASVHVHTLRIGSLVDGDDGNPSLMRV